MTDTIFTNPWLDLPRRSPFVLPLDRDFVEEHNRKVAENFRYHTELYPEPFAGRLDAPVVVLALNPGFDPGDQAVHGSAVYQELWCRNMEQTLDDYPLFLIHEKLRHAPCFRWWTAKLRYLIDIFGLAGVARSVLEVQLFPYHSREFRRRKGVIPSQEFAVRVVRRAMANDAVIILMRSRKIWEEYVPELASYGRLLQVRNPRNPTFSEKNLPGIEIAVRAIEQA
jgi:hypothetical protein